jgi:LemA protein
MYFVLFLIALMVFGVWLYNRLVASRNTYKNAYAQIDVQLKRRHDLIPNVVNTVKAYLAHERGTLEAVIAARNTAQSAAHAAAQAPGNKTAMQALAQSENALSQSLGKLAITVEAYPELSSSANMQQLTEELASTENRIGFARQAYNDAVTDYNNAREQFPSSILAGLFNFKSAELLQSITRDVERDAPSVTF